MSKPTTHLAKTAFMLALLFAAGPAGDISPTPVSGIRTALELTNKPAVRMVKLSVIA